MPLGSLRLVSSFALPGKAGLSLDIMRAPGGETMIRLRRKVGAGVNEIAALMPAKLLMPQASVAGAAASAYVTLADGDGSTIDTAGSAPAGGEPRFKVAAKSARFGLAYRHRGAARDRPGRHMTGVRWLGMIAVGAVLRAAGRVCAADAAARAATIRWPRWNAR